MRAVEGDRRLSDPYFYPLYREAARLDLPICIHASAGNFGMLDLFGQDSGFAQFKLPVVGAFHDLLMKGTPAKFPDLRWAFIEVSSQWIPYALNDMELRFRRGNKPWLGPDVLRDNRMYVACQTTDDIPYVRQYVGDDNIVTLIGSRALAAYGDADGSSAANNRLWSRKWTARLLRRSDASASVHGCAGTRSVRLGGAGSVG